ncbi:MAG: DinB family protein [Acidobacteria bacterium]|nr:DinB family protein [Acidobacteriota bacterium]
MLTDILIEIYERDLEKLKAQIEAYPDEDSLWKTDGQILNSAGNLCLHLNGNLQHFFGAVIGGTGYQRDRDLEFKDTRVSREKLLAGIVAARESVVETLMKMTPVDYEKTYPIEVYGKPMTTGFFFVTLSSHFNWHLGQIDYHRRLLAS